VEGRDGHAILLDINAVLQGVWGSDLAGLVLGSHIGGMLRRRGFWCAREVAGDLSCASERSF